MHNARRHRHWNRYWIRIIPALMLASLPVLASAKVGFALGGDSVRETYNFPAGEAEVDWTRITLMPWWKSGPWDVKAEIPYLIRNASTTGTTAAIQHQNGTWTPVLLLSDTEESDQGLGDIYTSVSYSWQPEGKRWLRPYLVTEVKLPTGDADAIEYYFDPSFSNSGRSSSAISFGNGSTDVRVGPGLEARNPTGWLRGEVSQIWSKDNGDFPTQDRFAAYAGLGYTPLDWLELTTYYNFEGEVTDKAGDLNQVTYAVLIRPRNSKLTVSISTYENNDAPDPSKNWSIGMMAGF